MDNPAPISYREPLDGMVDLETLGRKPFYAVLSIGACTMRMDVDPRPLRLDEQLPAIVTDVFFAPIDMQSSLDLGLKVDAETLVWWLEQSEEAQAAAFRHPNAMKLPDALDAFTTWVNSRPMSLWGNSARFDLGMLEALYTVCGKQVPWEHWRERDYRTIKNLTAAKAIEIVRVGTHHNPADDAVSQALHLAHINHQLGLQL